VGIAVGDWYTASQFIGGAFGAGAAGGFAGGFVASGGNLRSAVIGGFTGGLAGAIGQAFPTPPGTFASAEAIAAHAALGCASSTIGGGDCGSGALAGGFSKITSPYIAEFAGSATFSEKFTGAILAGAVGGTVSEMTGGKFSNGAITGAFAYLYNQISDSMSRSHAFAEARRAAGIPSSAVPRVTYEELYDGNRNRPMGLVDESNRPALARTYTYDLDGRVVVIQEHSAGHMQKDASGKWTMQEKGHFNVRDVNLKTFPGAQSHYEFRSKIDPLKYFWRRGGVLVPRGTD
jgi:hypothetical protein